jgi:hypothetical protein
MSSPYPAFRRTVFGNRSRIRPAWSAHTPITRSARSRATGSRAPAPVLERHAPPVGEADLDAQHALARAPVHDRPRPRGVVADAPADRRVRRRRGVGREEQPRPGLARVEGRVQLRHEIPGLGVAACAPARSMPQHAPAGGRDIDHDRVVDALPARLVPPPRGQDRQDPVRGTPAPRRRRRRGPRGRPRPSARADRSTRRSNRACGRACRGGPRRARGWRATGARRPCCCQTRDPERLTRSAYPPVDGARSPRRPAADRVNPRGRCTPRAPARRSGAGSGPRRRSSCPA